MTQNSGREPWESPEDLDVRSGMSPKELGIDRLHAERAARRVERIEQARERIARDAEIRLNAPCYRCGRENTEKSAFLGLERVCRDCEPIVVLRSIILETGFPTNADALAEALVQRGVGVLDDA